jgi:hypothetical protein
MGFLSAIIVPLAEWALMRLAHLGVYEIKDLEAKFMAKKVAMELKNAKTEDDKKSAVDDVAKSL